MTQNSDNCNSACSSCSASCSSRTEPQTMPEPPKGPLPSTRVKRIIGVVSGKGGVGKSLVTGLMASAMARRGLKVGILDGDITGPSIPKVFGLSTRALGNSEGVLLPVETRSGIRVMSINLLLKEDTDPVVWRGPVIAGAVEQFWHDVQWEELDCLLVDMPPGTGDVPLTVFKSLPVDGILVVTSPQELVSMIVTKAVHMARMMDIPLLGLVENMAYASCPGCSDKIYVFGQDRVNRVAAEFDIPLLASIPIDPSIATLSDEGRIEDYENSFFDSFLDQLDTLVPLKED